MDGYREGVFMGNKFGRQVSKKMVEDSSEWRGLVKGSEWGIARGVNP